MCRRYRALKIPNRPSGLNSFIAFFSLTLLPAAVFGHSLGPFFHNLEAIEQNNLLTSRYEQQLGRGEENLTLDIQNDYFNIRH